MGAEPLACTVPGLTVEVTAGSDGVGRCPCHGQGVVRVVVGEQALPPQREQVRLCRQSRLEPREAVDAVGRRDGVGAASSVHRHRHGLWTFEAGPLARVGDDARQVLVGP